MAHAKIRLELLHSCPDTVHGITLHKTLRSTFLTARKPSINPVGKGIRFCYSGLQIQGAANSPPTRSLYIIAYFPKDCNRFCMISLLFSKRLRFAWQILAKNAVFSGECVDKTPVKGYNNIAKFLRRKIYVGKLQS